jgi:hypothetical protein
MIDCKENQQRFCLPASRLFSGDPSSLLAKDSSYYAVGTVLQAALSTPFVFQLDTDQCPYSVFWHISLCSIMLAVSGNQLLNLTVPATAQIRLWLMPNNLVGSLASPQNTGGVSGFNPNNVGIELPKVETDLMNTVGPPQGGLVSLMVQNPFDIPPGWFLRLVILDNNGGIGVVPVGTVITLRMLRAIIPIDFTKLL